MKIKTYLTDESYIPTVVNEDIILRAKNTNIITLLVRDEEEQAVDITGSTVFFTVKSKTSDTDNSAVLKKDVTSHTYPASGQTDITITSTDTSSLLGNYLYSIKIKLSTGLIYTLAEGTICFQQELSTRES